MTSLKKITVITSVRNCLAETQSYLSSIKRYKSNLFNQLILIDDGSDDETKEFLLKQEVSTHLLRNEQSKGFALSNNLGVTLADSEWLLFMNNDLVLKPNWYLPFEKVAAGKLNPEKMGCLGNIQIDPRTKRIDHAGVIFRSGTPEHYLRDTNDFPAQELSEFLSVTGACFMIRRELFLEVGGFDETYQTGFEDIDLCLRLSMLGYRHYVANQSRILHKRSSTPERNHHQSQNSDIFYRRWGNLVTRFEEWENAQQMSESKKHNIENSHAVHVLKRQEKFLFVNRS